MNKEIYLGMRPGDLKDKPYAKYWAPEMQPLQSQTQAGVTHGPFASELGIGLDSIDALLQPGYLALENGYTQLSNGQYYVACLTRMPRVTGEMFEWWMGWHYMEPQRYKLWHPQAHLMNGTAKMQGDDPDMSNREKYQTTHFVTEYMGNNAAQVTISFSPANEYFHANKAPYTDEITALVCGRIALLRPSLTIGYVVHQIRQVEDGAEMRSRFWLGKPEITGVSDKDIRNRILGMRWLMKLATPTNFAQHVLIHCGMEMNHLSSFLPDLYADYNDT